MHKNSKNGVQLPFNDTAFIDKWQEWLQYRKERRLANYVPTGLKRTFNKLISDSNNDVVTAIEIINQSLGNGWQGLFPLKNKPNAINGQLVTGSNIQTKPGTSEARINAAKNW